MSSARMPKSGGATAMGQGIAHRADLDRLTEAYQAAGPRCGCGVSYCGHMLPVIAGCHPHAPISLVYRRDLGQLYAICSVCRTSFMGFAIAAGSGLESPLAIVPDPVPGAVPS